jgi:hypothetical protein
MRGTSPADYCGKLARKISSEIYLTDLGTAGGRYRDAAGNFPEPTERWEKRSFRDLK